MKYYIRLILLAVSLSPYINAKKYTHLDAQKIKCKTINVLSQIKGQNLVVCRNAVINDNLAINKNLAVCGNAAIGNNLNVNGITTLNNVIANNAVIGGIPFGSLTAFAYSVNSTPGIIIANGADLIFNRGNSLSSSNVIFSPATPTFTTISIPAGTYLFAYSVSAIGNLSGDQLSFALFNYTNGAIVPNTQYNSEQGLANPLLTKGYGLASFSVPTTLSLRNVSGQPIELLTGFPANTPVINSLILIRISN